LQISQNVYLTLLVQHRVHTNCARMHGPCHWH